MEKFRLLLLRLLDAIKQFGAAWVYRILIKNDFFLIFPLEASLRNNRIIVHVFLRKLLANECLKNLRRNAF